MSVCPCMRQKGCSIQRFSLYSGFSFGCFSAGSGHKQSYLEEKEIQRVFDDHEAMLLVILHQPADGIKFPCITNVLFSVVVEEEKFLSLGKNLYPRLHLHLCFCSAVQPAGKTPHLISSLCILQMSRLTASPSVPVCN